jgi:hypothetical protein
MVGLGTQRKRVDIYETFFLRVTQRKLAMNLCKITTAFGVLTLSPLKPVFLLGAFTQMLLPFGAILGFTSMHLLYIPYGLVLVDANTCLSTLPCVVDSNGKTVHKLPSLAEQAKDLYGVTVRNDTRS